jgi:Nucleotidyltransferase domain
MAARAETNRRLRERRKRFEAVEVDEDATVVLTGSWGRHEITSESDDDFMVVFESSVRDGPRLSVEQVARILGGRPPGVEDIFGKPVALEDLREKIGRDEDTNANLTRRMLFILESVAVCGAEVHARARTSLIDGYLAANVKDYRPPRFLLNDLGRYWRAIAVDFESKMRARKGEGWGLRNAKPGLSRKALFAGGLLPVLGCYRYPASDMLDYLDGRMSVPPLDRIADAFLDHGAPDPGVRALNEYDEFLGILDDSDQRMQLSALDVAEARDSQLFTRIAELGKEFEAGLLTLLFDDPELHRWVRDYLIF